MTAPRFTNKTRRGIPHLLRYICEDRDEPASDITLGPRGKGFTHAGHPMYRRLAPGDRLDLLALVRWLEAQQAPPTPPDASTPPS